MAIFKTFSRSILCAIFFLVSTNQNWSNGFLHLEEECKNYNDSLNFLQITPFNQIVRISLCNKNQTQPIVVKDTKILTFDVNVAKNYLIYATEEGKLFRKSLDTGQNLPQLLSEYKWFKVTQLAIDWIHDLLYMVADGSDLIVTSMSSNNSFNRIALLQSSSSRTIKKLLVYPKLSVLIWHEIDWLESVTNRIQMSKQDGTSMVNIYTITTYIHDLQIDHLHQMIYFIAQEELVQVSLFPLDHYQNSQQHSKQNTNFQGSKSFSLDNYDMKHFALLQPGFVQLAYYSLFFHYFDPTSSVLDNVPTKANFLINFRGLEKHISLNNDFLLAYPLSQPRRMQPLCPKNFCSELCVPNGYDARFTCLCYSQDVPCGDDGHYHSEHLQTTTTTTTTTTLPPPIIQQSNFSEHIFWKNVLARSDSPSDPNIPKSDQFPDKLEVKFDQTQDSSNSNQTENDQSEQQTPPNFNSTHPASVDHPRNLLISLSVNVESSPAIPDEKLMFSSLIGNFPHPTINLIENWIQKHRSIVCGILVLFASIIVAFSLAIVTRILKATPSLDERKMFKSKPSILDQTENERKIGLDESVKVLSVSLLTESTQDEELELLKTKNLDPNRKITPIFDSSIAYDNWEYENVHLNPVVTKQPVANYCNLKCPNLEII